MNQRSLNIVLLIVSALLFLFALLLGSTAISFSRLVSAIVGLGVYDQADQVIVWQIRFPRALAAYLVGAALGASGAALQGLLRNPLAEPGVLGVSACASLGATMALFFGGLGGFGLVLPLSAVAGALLATALLAAVAGKVQSMVTLILIGVGLSSFAGAVMALLMNLSPNPFTLADMVNWMLGSVSHRSLRDIALALPFLVLGMSLLIGGKRNLSALTLGEEAAQGVGLNLPRARALVIIGAGLSTGAAVALAGAIGFIGIVAPHLIRPLVKFNPSRVIVPSALLAGAILLLADITIRIIPTTTELKLGVVAALIGAPAFVWIASRRRLAYD